jgi:type IV pilus assembly protein PilA
MLKPELQVKFLQNLNRKKKGDEGFTLIELLVVVIIIGVLAAIALPSLLSQVSKARQSEAKQNVGAINRAQQAYFLENSNKFTSSMIDLAIGIKSQTENYAYSITATDPGKFAVNEVSARQPKLKSYAGVVYTIDQTVNNVVESLTQAILCEANLPNSGAAEATQAIDVAATLTTSTTNPCATVTLPVMKQIK